MHPPKCISLNIPNTTCDPQRLQSELYLTSITDTDSAPIISTTTFVICYFLHVSVWGSCENQSRTPELFRGTDAWSMSGVAEGIGLLRTSLKCSAHLSSCFSSKVILCPFLSLMMEFRCYIFQTVLL